MSKKTEKALFASLKETFSLGIREFSRSLTWTMPTTWSPKPIDWGSIDRNQIGIQLDHREIDLAKKRL